MENLHRKHSPEWVVEELRNKRPADVHSSNAGIVAQRICEDAKDIQFSVRVDGSSAWFTNASVMQERINELSETVLEANTVITGLENELKQKAA